MRDRTSSSRSSRSNRLSFHEQDPALAAAKYVDPDVYPPEIPRRDGDMQRGMSSTGSSSGSVPSSPSLKGMSKEEIRQREQLINRFEAEEEAIYHSLSKRLEEVRNRYVVKDEEAHVSLRSSSSTR